MANLNKKAFKKKPVKKIVKKIAAKRIKPAKKVVRKKTPAKKNRPAEKAVRKKAPAKKNKKPANSEKGFLGEITHYFPRVKAAVIKLKALLAVGDRIRVKGHTTDFIQTVSSLQIDRVALTAAKKGDEIGFMVESRVRRGDKVTKL